MWSRIYSRDTPFYYQENKEKIKSHICIFFYLFYFFILQNVIRVHESLPTFSYSPFSYIQVSWKGLNFKNTTNFRQTYFLDSCMSCLRKDFGSLPRNYNYWVMFEGQLWIYHAPFTLSYCCSYSCVNRWRCKGSHPYREGDCLLSCILIWKMS